MIKRLSSFKLETILFMGCRSISTIIGNLAICWTRKGISCIKNGGCKTSGGEPVFVKRLIRMLKRYFSGRRVSFKGIPLDLSSVNRFCKKVYQAVCRIKYGHKATYKQIARIVGCKNGARAVGMALSKNPVPIVIPCHRVIYSTGEIGRYSLGKRAKQTLLTIEKQKSRPIF